MREQQEKQQMSAKKTRGDKTKCQQLHIECKAIVAVAAVVVIFCSLKHSCTHNFSCHCRTSSKSKQCHRIVCTIKLTQESLEHSFGMHKKSYDTKTVSRTDRMLTLDFACHKKERERFDGELCVCMFRSVRRLPSSLTQNTHCLKSINFERKTINVIQIETQVVA